MKYESFEEWKKEVNRQVMGRIGLECDDLPDYSYADAYEGGESPAQVARDVVRAAEE